MAEILKSYSALSPSSSKSEVSAVLNAIVNSSPVSIDSSSRTDLIKSILKDLKDSHSLGSKTLSTKDASQALLAIKTLGKAPAGSEYLASPSNLSSLLSFTSTFKDDPEAVNETLRCIANALLLVEKGRNTFLQKDVDGGHIAISLLEKASTPDQIFILSRILFLCTVSGSSFIRTIVEEKHQGRTIVEIIGAKLDTLTISILAGTQMSREAMSDLLKFAFNLLLHYPKMIDTELQTTEAAGSGTKIFGDFWSPKLEGILPPLLRAFSSLPPTFPSPITAPLTHVIHALLAIPVSPLRPIWFGSNTSAHGSASSSPKNISTSSTPRITSASASSSRSDSPTRNVQSQGSPTSPKPSTLDRALSVIAAGRRSLSRSPSPNTAPPVDVLQRSYDLLEVAFLHHFPGDSDPDGQEVRDQFKREMPDSTLEDVLSPVVVLITRLCNTDEISRGRLRQWIVPDDLDRSTLLEGRPDLLGRCLRLLASVYHVRLKDAVGEMLFAMSGSDASVLTTLLGYGNVAGLLYHKGGILGAPPLPDVKSTGATFTTPSGPAINPITGTTVQPSTSVPEMTDDEKEAEMEKLFVLFDRLERTGAIPPSQNPMRKAIQQAKFGGS